MAQERAGSPAFEACVPEEAREVPVSGPTSEGLFVAASGERFFASDLHVPEAAAPDRGPSEDDFSVSTGQWEAVAQGSENRWGLIPAWIMIIDGTTGRRLYQVEQLRQGKALFAPVHAAGACADSLRQAERQARHDRSGLWRDRKAWPVYSAAAPERLSAQAGRYSIIEGRIVSLGKTEHTRYLNFGRYWKTDFTGSLKIQDEEVFNAALGRAGWELDALTGVTVELRGVVQERDGPLITLRHPEQLVVTEHKRAGRAGQDSD
ncbi:hypothetical protein [Roseibium sp.]|uniref:hypothetical protein n=1 Tax=Roseibium sp. TaxID=1936156 RepID=UPI003D0F4A02